MFRSVLHLKRHRGICTRVSLKLFNFNHYTPTKSIFDKLECEGIYVQESERLYPYFATFDCEACQDDVEPESGGTITVKKHEVISLSVASNVYNISDDGEIEFDFREPKCFKGIDPQLLVNRAVHYMKSISDASATLAKRKWSNVIEELDAKIASYDADYDDEVKKEENEADEEDTKKPRNTVKQRLNELRRSFIHDYCGTLPIFGYNSSNYDLNLIQPYLFPVLGIGKRDNDDPETTLDPKPLPYDSRSYVIKKNNSYTAITANGMKFLDVTNFQVQGLSLSQFLKAHHTKESKSFLPYEWMKNADCLDHPGLPPYISYFSTIKGKNLLEEGDRTTGLKRYAELQRLWQEKEWKCFGDYLEYSKTVLKARRRRQSMSALRVDEEDRKLLRPNRIAAIRSIFLNDQRQERSRRRRSSTRP